MITSRISSPEALGLRSFTCQMSTKRADWQKKLVRIQSKLRLNVRNLCAACVDLRLRKWLKDTVFSEFEFAPTFYSVLLHLDNNRVFESYRIWVHAGFKVGEPEDMFWGDRMAHTTDPFGHSWTV